MTSQDDIRNPLEEIADEFIQRRRLGEAPTIDEYASDYPLLAKEIYDLFPTLELMEHVRRDVADKTIVNIDPTSNVGQQLGDFHILREIGRGGMGVVYEAHQSSLGRRVALKVLASNLQHNDKYLERFRREATAAAKLQHSNIVPVYGVGTDDGQHYYAMQYIHGRGLDEVLKALQSDVDSFRDVIEFDNASDLAGALVTGQFKLRDLDPDLQEPVAGSKSSTSDPANSKSVWSPKSSDRISYFRRIARLGSQAANGLAHAHGNGILHRDIKPSNLLLDVYGNIWITDFGLVKMMGEDDLTETGDIVGTLRYISPESLHGKYDVRSDIYGLGLTLHELLARKRAFSASHRATLTKQILEQGPGDLLSVPKDLATIVQKATSLDPDDRYQTAPELSDDLNRFLNHEPIRARKISSLESLWRWSKRNRMLAASLTAVAFLLIFGLCGAIFTSFQWNKLAEENKSAFLRAAEENRDARRRLVEANILFAQDRAKSRLPGQRLSGLKAIAESVPIAKELEMGEETMFRLRNAAIPCLANNDIETLREWIVTTTTIFEAAFDSSLERYAFQRYSNGPIEVRNTKDDSHIAVFTPDQPLVRLQFSPDGKYLAAHLRERVVVWNVDSRQVVHAFGRLRYSRAQFQFDAQSKRIAIATLDDDAVRVYELEKQEPIFEVRKCKIGGLCFDDSNQLIITRDHAASNLTKSINEFISGQKVPTQQPLSKRGIIEFFDLETGNKNNSIPIDGSPGYICYGDGLLAVATLYPIEKLDPGMTAPTSMIRIYEGPNFREITRMPKRYSTISKMQFIDNGKLLAVGRSQNTTELWNVRTGAKVLAVDGELVTIANDRLAVSGFGRLRIYRLITSKELSGLCPKYIPQKIKVDKTNRILFAPLSNGLELYDIQKGTLLAKLKDGRITNVTVAPDGTSFYIVDSRRHIERWPIHYAKEIVTVGPPTRLEIPPGFFPHHLAISRDGTVLVSESPTTNQVLVVSTNFVFENFIMKTPPSPLFIAISNNTKWVATGTWHGSEVGVYDLEKRKLVRKIPHGRTHVGFTPDSSALICGGGKLVNLNDWSERTINDNASSYRIESPCIPQDGSFLVVTENRVVGSSVIFDPKNWNPLLRLTTPNAVRHDVAGISQNGHHIFIRTFDGLDYQIKSWNLFEIRKRLKELGLDWNGPELKPETPYDDELRITVERS